MSTRTFVIIMPAVSREIIVTTMAPRVGEILSSRHPGLFDAGEYLQEGPPPGASYGLTRTAWLLDKPIRFLADCVRAGLLDGYQNGGDIEFPSESITRLVSRGLPCEAPEWSARVRSVRKAQGPDVDGEVWVETLSEAELHRDHRQLTLGI